MKSGVLLFYGDQPVVYFSGSHSSVLNDETGNPSVLNNSPTTKSLKA